MTAEESGRLDISENELYEATCREGRPMVSILLTMFLTPHTHTHTPTTYHTHTPVRCGLDTHLLAPCEVGPRHTPASPPVK